MFIFILVQTKQVRNDSGGGGALAKFLGKFAKSEVFVDVAHSAEQQRGRRANKEARDKRNTRFHWQVKVCLSARKAPVVLAGWDTNRKERYSGVAGGAWACIAVDLAVGKGSRDVFVYRTIPSGMTSHESLLVLHTWAKFHEGSNWPLCSEQVEELRSWVWSAGQLYTRLTYQEQQTDLLAADRFTRLLFYLHVNWFRVGVGKRMSIRTFSWRKKEKWKRDIHVSNPWPRLQEHPPVPQSHRSLRAMEKYVQFMTSTIFLLSTTSVQSSVLYDMCTTGSTYVKYTSVIRVNVNYRDLCRVLIYWG